MPYSIPYLLSQRNRFVQEFYCVHPSFSKSPASLLGRTKSGGL
jgi:hypothetical protein